MSDYRGHIAAGAAFYGVYAFAFVVIVPALAGRELFALAREWWEIPAQLAVAVLAALWPDVDIASTGRKLYYRLFLALDIYLIAMEEWRAAAFLGLVAILPGIGRHRGWTHRLWAAAIVPAPIVLYPLFARPDGGLAPQPDLANLGVGLPYYLAALAGYLSHLAADDMLGGVIGRIMQVLLWPIRTIGGGSGRDHGRV